MKKQRSRTFKDAIPEKIRQVDALRGTLSVKSAVKQVGISYPCYLAHRADASGTPVNSLRVQNAMTELVNALREEVVKEVIAKMEIKGR